MARSRRITLTLLISLLLAAGPARWAGSTAAAPAGAGNTPAGPSNAASSVAPLFRVDAWPDRWAVDSSPPPDGLPETPAAPPTEASPDWWAAVQEEIRRAEYHVTWQDQAGTYQAPNRAHNLRTTFTPQAIVVIPRVWPEEAGSPPWRLELGMSGTGRAELRAKDNRIEYHREAPGEWYVNDERGLEWGFEIRNSNFEFRIALHTSLTPVLVDGQTVEFYDAAGEAVLRYGDATATDAAGRDVPVQLELVPALTDPSSPSLTPYALLVTCPSTSYPLTVLAHLTSPAATRSTPLGLSPIPDWSVSGSQTGEYLGFSVDTAGDVNGDGYSDLIVGAPYHDTPTLNGGAARVYHGSPDGLGTSPAWSASSDNHEAWFGSTVSPAGDVNGDGYADVAVAAANDEIVYVYLGSAAGLLSTPACTLTTDQVDAHFGISVGTAGDVDGDGYSDLIVGADNYSNGNSWEGRAFVYLGSASGLVVTPTWTAESNATWSHLGASVGTAGDVNGDGYSDVVVGAPYYEIGSNADAGTAFVWYGSAGGLGEDGTPLNADWSAEGPHTQAYLGGSVSTAGDVDGDGYSDLVVGAEGYSSGQSNEGAAFVFLGAAAGPAITPSATLEENWNNARLGCAVSAAGDVDGDGYADVVVGAHRYGNGQTEEGAAFVYRGSAAGLVVTATWSAESDQGAAWYGFAVGTAGDVDGDGFSDLVVGAHLYNQIDYDVGRAYVYHGAPGGLNPEPGWTAESNQGGAEFGHRLGTAGDVNGDGYADVIVGARFYDNGQTDEGAAFVYHGSPSGLSTTPNWTAEGDQTDAYFAWSVSTAGDVNGDGYDDVIVGAAGYDNGETDEGRAFVYYGSPAGLGAATAWTAESNQAQVDFGSSVSTAGDVNGDGYSDVIVGAHLYDNGQADEGRAYVYHGSSAGLSNHPAWTAEGEQADGQFGWSVGPGGDVNGDGYSDIVVGAYLYDNGQTDEGRAFVYHGSDAGLSAAPNWTGEGNQADARFGHWGETAGDVNGDGYADVIIGVPYYDNGQAEEGRAYVYHGSASGLSATPNWTAEGDQDGAYFAWSVGTAGDVNGDGYADAAVGAMFYSNPDPNEGRAYVYHGSAAGLSASADWTAEGNQETARFGVSVGTGGDVNGDGYADVVVGAMWYENDQGYEGAAFLYYGNEGDGLSVTPRQMRTDGSAPIALLGMSDSTSAVQLRLTGRMPLGREQVKLHWQVAPLGTPFTGTGAISGTSVSWSDTLTTGVVLSQNAAGLNPDTPYHWRVRLLYRPGNRLGLPAGRWVHVPWNGWNEQDLRTPEPIVGLVAFNDSPTVLGYPTTLSATVTGGNPVTFEWSFGDGSFGSGATVSHTYPLVGDHTALVSACNPLNTLTTTTVVTILPPCQPVSGTLFSWLPLTPTVGEMVSFQGSAGGTPPIAFAWDLGDGSSAGGPGPTHAYAAAGDYTVVLTAGNACGQETLSRTLTVVEGCNPIYDLDLNWLPFTPTVGQEVAFQSSAGGTPPFTFSWDLGDGSSASGPDITHTYTAAGDYTIRLTGSNPCGQETAAGTLTVVPLEPDILVTPLALSATLNPGQTALRYLAIENRGNTTLTWSAAEVPPVDWLAAAPPGGPVPAGQSTAVSVTFDAAGLNAGHYGTSLRVNSDDPDTPQVTVTATLEVTTSCIPPHNADFSWTPPSPTVGAPVTFDASTEGTLPFTFTWAFGDGGGGSGPTATHVYSAPGSYDVRLTAANACGQNTVTRPLSVALPAPTWSIYLPLVLKSF